MTLLKLLWSKAAGYVLAAVGLLATLAAFAASQRRAGRQQERAATLAKTMEIRDAQDQAAARAAGDDTARRLRDGSF
ncbi:hypothetical protein [Azospirillum sp. ST 5-10]|uniref:hypothetical protein n=1 Tax=unclassified Azospirillum TaxID=2630922 RepID=UPI003F4A189A